MAKTLAELREEYPELSQQLWDEIVDSVNTQLAQEKAAVDAGVNAAKKALGLEETGH